MKVTEITSDNAEYFEDLIPEGYLENENLLWLGAIAGRRDRVVSLEGS